MWYVFQKQILQYSCIKICYVLSFFSYAEKMQWSQHVVPNQADHTDWKWMKYMAFHHQTEYSIGTDATTVVMS